MGGTGSVHASVRNGTHGGEYLRFVPRHGSAASGTGAWISDPGPGSFHAFHRGTAAGAVGEISAKPHTGVLYVLVEPSIGLHPSNIEGLRGVMQDLIADGNSIVLVDHDTEILKDADWLIEMGPEAGEKGGTVIAQGTIDTVAADPNSKIGGFLSGANSVLVRKKISAETMFEQGTIEMTTGQIHTVKPLTVKIPKGRMTAITGVSGSGKTTLILESLIPGLQAAVQGEALPEHVKAVSAPGIGQVKLIDATPIGINIRSTVATYAGIHDELRKIYAKTPDAKEGKYKAGDFSYNTGKLRCPTCDGTGSISLDIQFLPGCGDCLPGVRRLPLQQGRVEGSPRAGGWHSPHCCRS